MSKIYDVIGVGFGPSNLALAITLQEAYPEITSLFLEAKPEPDWQEQMLIARSNIQHNPHNDLVTLRNPKSHYSFTNYLYENDLLFEHHHLHLEAPLRIEYGRYFKWAASFFKEQLICNTTVAKIEIVNHSNEQLYKIYSFDNNSYLSRNLIIGTGRTPHLPEQFAKLTSDKIIHLSGYSASEAELKSSDSKTIAVVGSGQSAAEIICDIFTRFPQHQVSSYIRHFGFRLKDTNPFMENCILPEYIPTFYNLSFDHKKKWLQDLHTINYSAADMDVLEELYLLNYERKHYQQRPALKLLNNSNITKVTTKNNQIQIHAQHLYDQTERNDNYDLVYLATGFKNIGPEPHNEPIPALLQPLSAEYKFNQQGYCHINYDYSLTAIDPSKPKVFLNGLCELSHGISDAGSFSLVSLRAKKIADSLHASLYQRRVSCF